MDTVLFRLQSSNLLFMFSTRLDWDVVSGFNPLGERMEILRGSTDSSHTNVKISSIVFPANTDHPSPLKIMTRRSLHRSREAEEI